MVVVDLEIEKAKEGSSLLPFRSNPRLPLFEEHLLCPCGALTYYSNDTKGELSEKGHQGAMSIAPARSRAHLLLAWVSSCRVRQSVLFPSALGKHGSTAYSHLIPHCRTSSLVDHGNGRHQIWNSCLSQEFCCLPFRALCFMGLGVINQKYLFP